MKKKFDLVVIPHTHWDLEWYGTEQDYQSGLVDLMSRIFKALKNPGYKYFHFDGQVGAIESYLEARPEDRGRIKKLVRSGRLLIGPWYQMPEEFMPSGESLIRNLLLGTEIAKGLGGIMKIGYLVDPVSHISQLSQILNGFGIEDAVLWRGVFGTEGIDKSEFRWESPDGSAVFVLALASFYGYLNFGYLSGKFNEFMEKLEACKSELEPFAGTRYLVLMNGGDYLSPVENLPELVKKADKLIKPHHIYIDTLPAIIKKMRRSHDPKTYRGEFISSERSAVLPGIYSTRMGIKLAKREAEISLEKWAEPFSVLSWTLGKDYPAFFVRKAWKSIVKNTFHDSIYGGHVDEVTPYVMGRYQNSTEISMRLTNISLYNIAEMAETPDSPHSLVVFNPLNWERNGVFSTDILVESQSPLKGLRLLDKGRYIPCQINHKERIENMFLSPRRQRETPTFGRNINKYNVSFLAEDVPAVGYKSYSIIETDEPDNDFKSDLICNGNTVSNQFIKVCIKSGGTFDLYDKKKRRWYRDLNTFVDIGERGDQYTHSPIPNDIPITNKGIKGKVSLMKNGPLEVEYRIDITLKRSKGCSHCCPLSTYINVRAYSPRVDIRTELVNNASDHRLRVLFPTKIKADYDYIDTNFSVEKRKREIPDSSGWIEIPTLTRPQRLFAALSQAECGITIINKGLPSYEIDKDGNMYLDLLRCTGELSKPALPERMLLAGPKISTPGAQNIGRFTLEYAVYPHSGDWKKAGSYRMAEEHNAPMKAMETGRKKGLLPSSMSFLNIEGDGLILTALKKAEKGNAIIVRFYNILPKAVSAKITFYKKIKKAYLVRLDESSIKRLPVKGNSIRMDVGANKIITVAIY